MGDLRASSQRRSDGEDVGMSFTQEWAVARQQDQARVSEYEGEPILERLYNLLYPNGDGYDTEE